MQPSTLDLWGPGLPQGTVVDSGPRLQVCWAVDPVQPHRCAASEPPPPKRGCAGRAQDKEGTAGMRHPAIHSQHHPHSLGRVHTRGGRVPS